MNIDWNAITGLFTALSFLTFGVTAVAGVIQIRYTRKQLVELSRATQLTGTMQIFSELNDPRIFAARRFVWAELPTHLADDAFVEELDLVGLADEGKHQELLVLRQFETIGSYVQYGLVDSEVILHNAAPMIVSTWEMLRPVIAAHRKIAYPGMYENFEHLYNRSVDFLEAHHGLEQFRAFYSFSTNASNS